MILCLGDLMVDVLAQLPGPLAVGSDTPAPVGVRGGGSAANTAAWLAATGARPVFVGRVGDDAFGRQAVDELQAAGVRPEVGVDPVRRTGICIVLVDPDGERTMIPSTGANSGLGEQGLPDDLYGATHLHVSGYALFNPDARPLALAALARARALAVSISIDAASSAPLRAAGAETFFTWIGTDLTLIANTDEARVLAAGEPAELARALGARVGAAVVKCGPEGAYWSDGQAVERAASTASVVLDTTGAGDAFAAGWLAGRIEHGQPVADALRRANQLAGQAVGRAGGRPPAGDQDRT